MKTPTHDEPNAHNPVPGYLDDDQLLLSLRHEGDLDRTRVAAVENFVADLIRQGLKRRRGGRGPYGRTNLRDVTVQFSVEPISFPSRRHGGSFTVLAGQVTRPDRRPGQPGSAVPVINLLNRELATFAREREEPPAVDGVMILPASPDWIVGTAGDVIIRGGPGSAPYPAPNGTLQLARFQGQEEVYKQWECEPNGGKGVNVVVLDTIPDPEVLRQARQDSRYNELFQSLDARLTILDAGAHATRPGHRIDQPFREMEMRDHGLFVAGIVHSLAPEASIYLIEVLNPYGVGDLCSLLAGLSRAAAFIEKGPLVINCSLTLAIPPKLETNLTGVWGEHVLPLEESCNELVGDEEANSKVVLVGAAGNDSRDEGQGRHRHPSYPAALNSVIGVAALGRDAQPAVFSNRADTELTSRELRSAGVATFGGLDDPTDAGVLGVYSAKTFPNGEENTHGWAYWAGTSFAAPIISGIVANGFSCGADFDTRPVLAAVHAVAHQPSPDDPDTVVGEALEIQQG